MKNTGTVRAVVARFLRNDYKEQFISKLIDSQVTDVLPYERMEAIATIVYFRRNTSNIVRYTPCGYHYHPSSETGVPGWFSAPVSDEVRTIRPSTIERYMELIKELKEG